MKKFVFLLLSSSLFAQQKDWLAYEQSAFDSPSCCWRKLADEQKFEAGAKLIIAYIETGKPKNKQSLNWHAGQMFALAEMNQLALKYMGKTYSPFQKWFGGEDGKTWYFFAKGTSCFLKRDRPKLESIINRWKRRWPVDNNLRELEKLLSNWDLNYENATLGKTPILQEH